jgi:YD repeat-containing protein
MTASRQYNNLNRLTNIVTASDATTFAGNAYTYNAANQRTCALQADGSYWTYQYDSLGQVTSGKNYWSDGSPVAGQQFEYGFDFQFLGLHQYLSKHYFWNHPPQCAILIFPQETSKNFFHFVASLSVSFVTCN